MKVLFVLLIVVTTIEALLDDIVPFLQLSPKPLIVGGSEAEPNSFPYQVGLKLKMSNGGSNFCGGSLIKNNLVLTAAHCLYEVIGAEVILGAHKIKEIEPTQVRVNVTKAQFVIHQNYNPTLTSNDIALIKLSNEIVLNEKIQVLKLPANSDDSYTGDYATVSGWGKDADSASSISPVLRHTTNPVISNLKCSLTFLFYIRPTNICVSGSDGKSACNGDSGGPLVVLNNGNPEQVGIVSFGSGQGCEKGSPVAYTRVTSYLNWIAQNA